MMPCDKRVGKKVTEGLDRRNFLKTAVSIGGINALTACIDREDTESVPAGSVDLPERQHEWNNYLRTDENGVHIPPRHHILLLFDYIGDNIQQDRAKMEQLFREFENAYDWSNSGLLFNIGYSPSYFERMANKSFDILPKPSQISSLEDPKMDDADVSVHLASDHAHVVLGAEEAIYGEVEVLNGTDISGGLSSIFETYDRRTGFIGEGLPAENQDVDGIPESEPVPEEAPLYMGFESQHSLKPQHPDYEEDEVKLHNQATEDKITIEEGPYAGGTTQHISKIRLSLGEWYEKHTLDERAARMFEGLEDTSDKIGKIGQRAQEADRFQNNVDHHAEEYGRVGHAEKAARARENHSPLLLRRDFDTTDEGHAGVHFVSLQKTINDFVKTRAMIDGDNLVSEHDSIGEVENNGILRFIEVKRRANFLIPPREDRSLPNPG